MVTTIDPYRDKQTIKNIILEMVQRKKQVVYGQQSVNVQLPKHLRRKTKDVDIYTKKPEESAKELVDRLNKEFHTKKFKVVKGISKGTFKVKKGKKTIADYTSRTRKPTSKKILGIPYASLKYQKKRLTKTTKDPSLKYRHKKDMATLDKLNKYEMTKFLMS